MKGKLLVIGFGPGSFEHITKRAKEAIEESDCVIGYKTYVNLIEGLLTDQEIISTGMSEEVSRAQAAVKLAEEGKKVAVISSGDAGVYGMAGLIYEVLIEKSWKEETGVRVEVIPGISAINSCASLLGAPVMHDACTISLSDHLTPWELIVKRIEAAGMADFVIALYNPKSGRRTRQIVEAQKILLRYRSPETPVGLVKSAYRERESVVITTLADMLDHDIGMLTTVIIGSSSTFLYDNKMITPRGYQRKYTLNSEEQRLKLSERLRPENEPWALHQGQKEKEENAKISSRDRSLNQLADPSIDDAEVHPANHSTDYSEDHLVDQLKDQTVERLTGSTPETSEKRSPVEWAMEALNTLDGTKEAAASIGMSNPESTTAASAIDSAIAASTPAPTAAVAFAPVTQAVESIFELAVSPGVVNKKFTPQQMITLAQVVGEQGTMEYTPHHQILLRIPTSNPDEIVQSLKDVGLLLSPVGDVLTLKACDFCEGEKKDSIPQAEEIQRKLGGLELPKEMKIGFNGCGMACFGAVNEDIGIVFRKGKFDLFLGAKTVGRTAHPGQIVAEGIEPDKIVEVVEGIVREYKEKGYPNERFHKFFRRVGQVRGFTYQDITPNLQIDPALCGD